MELYILSKQDLSILSICKLADYQINLDEETNAKSTFTLMKTNGLKKENYMVLNGLYRQFIFVIDDVQTEKGSDVVTVTALDISNIFDRKVIEKNIDIMKSKSIEEFIANTMSENFVNSDDTTLNVDYIDIAWKTNTKTTVATNAENGLYNFHTFLINCRQYKNIYTDFKLENLGNPQTVEGKRINVEAKNRKIVDIMLEGESQQATRSGKNLLDNTATTKISNGITFTVNSDKTVNVNGTNDTSANSSLIINRYDLSPGTYILNGCPSGGSSTTYRLAIQKTSDWSILGLDTGSGSEQFTIDEATKIQVAIFIQKGQTISNLLFKPMIRLSSIIDDTYEPYGVMPSPDYLSEIENIEGNIELKATNGLEETDENYQEQVATFPLGEEKLMEGSYLADDGVHHSRKQLILDGTETWLLEGTNAYIKIPDARGTINSVILSNYFKYEANASVWGQIRFGRTNNNLIIYDVVTEKGSLANFKTWLATKHTNGTPVILEYELAEEEIVPYTTAQQEAWDNIKNLTLFEGVNHISSDANMVLKYYPLESVGLKFVLRIDIENKQETTELIDTTLSEVTDYNKIYEEDVTAKVQVYIREDGSEYNLYLKTDRTTTTNKDDPDRASGKIEVISVETADKAEEEALNVMKGNNYKHLVEFKITKTSKLMDITKLHIRKTYKNQNRRRYI